MRRSVHRGISELYADLSLRLLVRGHTIPHICLMFYGQHKGALNPCPKPLEQGHGGNTVFRIWVVTFCICLIGNAIKRLEWELIESMVEYCLGIQSFILLQWSVFVSEPQRSISLSLTDALSCILSQCHIKCMYIQRWQWFPTEMLCIQSFMWPILWKCASLMMIKLLVRSCLTPDIIPWLNDFNI